MPRSPLKRKLLIPLMNKHAIKFWVKLSRVGLTSFQYLTKCVWTWKIIINIFCAKIFSSFGPKFFNIRHMQQLARAHPTFSPFVQNVQNKNLPPLDEPAIMNILSKLKFHPPEDVVRTAKADLCTKIAHAKFGRYTGTSQLCQFLWKLLIDPKALGVQPWENGVTRAIVEWTGKEYGFVFKDPESVAKQWGQSRNNQINMTYDKMSRTIRYNYSRGFLAKFDSHPHGYKWNP